MNKCPCCGVLKSIDDFFMRANGKPRHPCKMCLAERARTTRAAKSVKFTCPSCGQVEPASASLQWREGWSHRCPHGEPCPCGSRVPEFSNVCTEPGCAGHELKVSA